MKLTIVIPTLNEVGFLKKTIAHLLKVAHEPDQIEIIVIDAGSTDGTLQSIDLFSCKTYSRPDFALKKYQSLNFGLEKSESDFVLFLDADTSLPENFDQSIQLALQNSNMVGGAFEFDFIEQGFFLWIIRSVNRIRYRLEQSYYGDQAVFCRREVADKIGGVPSRSLMESAYFCRELLREGKLQLIKDPVKTSPRRFNDHGIWKVMWFDFRMWIRFLLHLDIEEFGEKYWKQEH
ncbi:MAG: glycosyltransferase [Cytophagales bacterium]|nr:glycosyltransferase [Cytophagales bacterium]